MVLLMVLLPKVTINSVACIIGQRFFAGQGTKTAPFGTRHSGPCSPDRAKSPKESRRKPAEEAARKWDMRRIGSARPQTGGPEAGKTPQPEAQEGQAEQEGAFMPAGVRCLAKFP